ncbi:uncharacterized protein LOC135837291 isoform X2 [Planococcus citri]|uniref:uncharacterized protein LOC135837291 isoform X2 n=1 Tax=Planococcus citri TaxID=170843 RepID=UPI0031F917FF
MYIDKVIWASLIFINTYLASADTIMQLNSTETIRNSIIDIFQIFETTKISKLFDENENLNTTVHFTLKNTTQNVHLHQLHVHKQRFPFLNMYCNFSNGNLHFTAEELTISINGTMQNPDNSSKNHFSLNWTATLKAVLIKITGLFTNLSNEELPIDVSFRKFCEDFPYEIYNESLHSSKPAIADQKLMEKSLTPKMISLVRKYLITRGRKLLNEYFRQNLRTNYFSNHSNLLENHHRYEYFIPNVSSIWFDLTNITIFGLANFKSFNAVVKKDDSFIGALLMRDIEGTMILDYGSLIEAPIELNFNASCIEILIKRSGDRVYVEAQNYKITPTMSDHRSAVTMQRIEYAIAASMWPSMNVFWKEHQLRRIYDPESPHRKTDWNTIAQLFNKSIPFDYNPPTNITTTVVSNCIEQKAQKFDISFHNMTVKLTLGNHYPKEIDCEFLHSLKVNYEMKANPTENISLHNNGNIISINFHANFTSIIFSTTGSNNSRINNTCEVYNIPIQDDIE